MRLPALLVITLWLACPPARGQSLDLINPSFEDGAESPTGWRLVGSGRCLSDGAAAGRRAVVASGTGNDHSFWQSSALPLRPGALYGLAFRARSLGAQGGTAMSGPAFCNRDLGTVPTQWTDYQSFFLTPRQVAPDQAVLRFGQWHVRGEVAFDDIQISPALPVHARYGDLVLGEGETLLGTQYVFEAPFRAASRNFSRPLVAFDCSYNTDRWVFPRASEVLYRHALNGRRQISANLSIAVSYHVAGQLDVEASADGENWRTLGRLNGLGSPSFALPSDLLPAETVHVRLRARPETPGGAVNLQVDTYSYRASIDGSPLFLVGQTHFLTVPRSDSRISVSIEDLGQALPGARNEIVARIVNQTDNRISCQPAVSVYQEGHPPLVRTAPAVLEPGPVWINMPYDLPGAGDYRIEFTLGPQLAYSAQVKLTVPGLHDSSYGQTLPSADPNVSLWWASSGWKISRTRPAPKARGETMLIRAARNEAEAAQFVVRAARPLRGLTVEPAALEGPAGATIAPQNIAVLRVQYVTVTQPTDHTGVAGPWPDPLPPVSRPLELETGANQPFWVRITVPKDARPGTYTGTIQLKAIGYQDRVPLRLEVYDFTLPDRMTCQTAFGFSPQLVWKYQKLENRADRLAVLEKYLANFSAHHISPYDPAPLHPIRVTWPDRKTLVPVIDFSAWDQAMARAIDVYHFNSFMIHIPGMGGGTFHSRYEPELLGYRENQPEYKLAFTNYCRILEDHLRQKGWLDEAFVYWFDEPDPKDYEFVMNGFRKLKEAAPAINRMLTEQVEPELIGGPNIWCPVSPEYRHDLAEQRRQAGERFWWYICTGPKAPYCTLFIDHPATELRVWLWQTWQRKIDGVLIWQTNYWTSDAAYPERDQPQNPYEDPMGWVSGYSTPQGARRPWGNGDGRFIYPPELAAGAHPPAPVLEGPVDSIRWEMLRDGIEDYEYLAILRRLLASKGQALSADQRAAFAALLDVPPDITRDMTSFTTDPGPIETRRHALAKAIESLGRL